jgi:hypothetical protein
MATPVTVPRPTASAGVVPRTGTGLLRQASLPQGAQQGLISQVRKIVRVSVGPLFHRQLLTGLAGQQEIVFFANRPAAGGLSWWLGNFKNDYIKTATLVFGVRLYIVGSGVTATNHSGIIVTTGATFIIANAFMLTWNQLNDGLVRIKVNDTEHPYIDSSKILAPMKYTEWGYDDGAGNASYATFPQCDTMSGYFMFKNSNREVDPITISKDDEFSITMKLPTILAAAPADTYVSCDLIAQASQMLFAG